MCFLQCKEFEVEVRNVRGASVEAVAEHVLGFYSALRRRLSVSLFMCFAVCLFFFSLASLVQFSFVGFVEV